MSGQDNENRKIIEDPEVLYDIDDHVAIITLNRPERMNTISRTMLEMLSQLLVAANEDFEIRAVILTGKGRAFCAGLDLKEKTQGKDSSGIMSNGDAATNFDLRNATPVVLQTMDKPTICALNGSSAGYGMDTALGCDIRIMAETAKMSAAFAKRGLVPESGGTWYLPRLVGWSKASEIIFTGRTLSAEQCLELGLVSKVVPADTLMDEARALAQEIADNAPLAVQAAKRMMRMGLSESFPDHVYRVFLQLMPLMRTEDTKEGMVSFLEKRKPIFKGR